MRSATAGLLLAAAVVLAACARGRESTTSIGQSFDTSKLGAPVYPRAQPNEQGAVSATTSKGTTLMVGFKTADAFDKVYAYYKAELPPGSERLKIDAANGSVATFQIGDGNATDRVSVQLTQSRPGETDILITRLTKGG